MDQNQTDKMKILVVDDIPANMNLLRNTLEPQGYQIFWAPNGEVAIDIAKRNHPDLILLDVLMPGIDGYETCLRLKEEASTTHIPVIFVTAKDETADMVKGFRVGGVDYITKPFKDEEVLVRVSNHLKINQLTRELSEQNRKLSLANEQLQREITRRQQAEDEREQAVVRFRMNDKAVRRPDTGDPVMDKRGKVIGTVTSCAIDHEGFLLGQAAVPLEMAKMDTPLFIYQLGGGKRAIRTPREIKAGARLPMPDAATVLTRFPSRKKGQRK